MSTRPRPRPKPRPRVPSSAPLSSPGAGPSPLPIVSSLETVVVVVDGDDDAQFLKNTHRSLQTWKQLDKLADGMQYTHSKAIRSAEMSYLAQDTKKYKASLDETSDTEGNSAKGSPHRRKYRKANDQDARPDWTKDIKQATQVLLSTLIHFALIWRPPYCSLSSDDEDEDDLLEILNPAANRPDEGSEALKRNIKRQRSRSRSLTPPPTLPSHTLLHARETIRYASR